MKVRDVMTSEVTTANADTSLEEIATMMKSEDTGAIPVVEEEELLGLITDRDIVIRCVAEGRDPAEVSAEDILSENLEVVDPDTDVQEALDLMGRHQIRRLPVVENGKLVGMVSLGDLAVKQNDEQDTGEALKDVSKGVKQTRKAQPARARGRRRQEPRKPVLPTTWTKRNVSRSGCCPFGQMPMYSRVARRSRASARRVRITAWSQIFSGEVIMADYKRFGLFEGSDRGSQIGTALTFLFIGLGVGALSALLFAPQTGKQTRKQLRRRYEDALDGRGLDGSGRRRFG